MTTPTELWTGNFGDAYTKRNRVGWSRRVPFFTDIIAITGARSILEVGCNSGWNLLALRSIRPSMALRGIDLNTSAVIQAQNLGLDVTQGTIQDIPPQHLYDMTFTSGVLIHVPPTNITETMEALFARSKQYVLCIEYESEREEEVLYRGVKYALWKRPFGKMYEAMGLTMIESGKLGPHDGWDDCTYWLMSKE